MFEQFCSGPLSEQSGFKLFLARIWQNSFQTVSLTTPCPQQKLHHGLQHAFHNSPSVLKIRTIFPLAFYPSVALPLCLLEKGSDTSFLCPAKTVTVSGADSVPSGTGNAPSQHRHFHCQITAVQVRSKRTRCLTNDTHQRC